MLFINRRSLLSLVVSALFVACEGPPSMQPDCGTDPSPDMAGAADMRSPAIDMSAGQFTAQRSAANPERIEIAAGQVQANAGAITASSKGEDYLITGILVMVDSATGHLSSGSLRNLYLTDGAGKSLGTQIETYVGAGFWYSFLLPAPYRVKAGGTVDFKSWVDVYPTSTTGSLTFNYQVSAVGDSSATPVLVSPFVGNTVFVK